MANNILNENRISRLGTNRPDRRSQQSGQPKCEGYSENVICLSIAKAKKEYPELLAKHTDLSQDASFLLIAKDAKFDKPIYLNTKVNFIVADVNSSCIIIQQTACDNIIYINEAATVSYYKIDNAKHENLQNSKIAITQGKNSKLNFGHLNFGANTTTDVRISLAGVDSECNLQGLCRLNLEQKNIYNIYIDHIASQTTSNELYKCVLQDNSTSEFCGRIKVHPGAQKSQAWLKNQNLLLSNNATARTLPELEIYADDVKCNHGATIGQLDPKAIFYLRSRGIDEIEARNMLVNAFIQEILDKIPNNVQSLIID